VAAPTISPIAVDRIRRILTLLSLVLLICALDVSVAWAQGAGGINRNRAPGFYFSIWKLGLYMALFWLWVKTTDWVSQDGYRVGTRHAVWNPIVVFPGFGWVTC
jgi:hypothetical protein